MCRYSSFHEVRPCVQDRRNKNEDLPPTSPTYPAKSSMAYLVPKMYPTSPIHHPCPRHVNKVQAQVSCNIVTYTTCILKKYSIFDSTNVENGVGFTFSLGRPYIVIITIFLGLAKPNLVHIDSNPIGESALPLELDIYRPTLICNLTQVIPIHLLSK
jgi:hypothetical protein